MIVFIVPVKSKKVSGNWESFIKLFERSIKSICNQTSKDFRVIVSCHEAPEIEFENERVHYHKVSFPPPSLEGIDKEKQRRLKEEDKAKKILEGLEVAKEFKASHFMVVDSDDCINNKIAEFANNDKTECPGWYIKKGYYYQEGKPYAFLNKSNFNKFCGSCIIIKSELVEHLFSKEPFLYYEHYTMVLKNGIQLKALPFAGAMYSMANGENHYMSINTAKSIANKPSFFKIDFLKSILSKLKKYSPKFITGNFKRSFNFYHV